MREETRERGKQPQREGGDRGEGSGKEPSQIIELDLLRTLDNQPPGVLSPGGTRWEISGNEPADPGMFTHRQDGSERTNDKLTREKFTALWANPDKHIKGWRRTDAPKDVHNKAKKSISTAEWQRKKRANDPVYRKEYNRSHAEWVKRKKTADDPAFQRSLPDLNEPAQPPSE